MANALIHITHTEPAAYECKNHPNMKFHFKSRYASLSSSTVSCIGEETTSNVSNKHMHGIKCNVCLCTVCTLCWRTRHIGTLHWTWHKMEIALVTMPFAFKFSHRMPAVYYYSSVCWGLCGKSSAYLQADALNGNHFVQSPRFSHVYTSPVGETEYSVHLPSIVGVWNAAYTVDKKNRGNTI